NAELGNDVSVMSVRLPSLYVCLSKHTILGIYFKIVPKSVSGHNNPCCIFRHRRLFFTVRTVLHSGPQFIHQTAATSCSTINSSLTTSNNGGKTWVFSMSVSAMLTCQSTRRSYNAGWMPAITERWTGWLVMA